MIYYFLPDPGIFGGVKVACQFLEMLTALGVRTVAVLPDGSAPQWFSGRTAILDEAAASQRVTERDFLLITWPPDYERLRTWPGRLVCHCQGTDELMSPIFADLDVPILTCWRQATDFVAEKFCRTAVEVGLSVSPCFYFAGGRKFDNLVAYMPRRGFPHVRRCMRRCASLAFIPISAMHEEEVADRLKRSGIFLATAQGEQFGLPALEAMAAGCVVLSVPVKGGMEYLADGFNSVVVDPSELPDRLNWIAGDENAEMRVRLRSRAVHTAFRYHPARQLENLSRQLRQELKWLR